MALLICPAPSCCHSLRQMLPIPVWHRRNHRKNSDRNSQGSGRCVSTHRYHLSSHVWCTPPDVSGVQLEICWCWGAWCLSHTPQQVPPGPACPPDSCSVSMSEQGLPLAEQLHLLCVQPLPREGTLPAGQQVLRWQMFSALLPFTQPRGGWTSTAVQRHPQDRKS